MLAEGSSSLFLKMGLIRAHSKYYGQNSSFISLSLVGSPFLGTVCDDAVVGPSLESLGSRIRPPNLPLQDGRLVDLT